MGNLGLPIAGRKESFVNLLLFKEIKLDESQVHSLL